MTAPNRTQKARVLAYLRERGATGGDPTAFLPPDVVDGGPPILKWGARILELRQAGHVIQAKGRRHGCSVMVLVDDAEAAATAPPAVDPASARQGTLAAPSRDGALFGSGVGVQPPLGPYEVER